MKKILSLTIAAAALLTMAIPSAAEVTPVEGIDHCYYNYICNKSVNEVKTDGVYNESEWSDAVELVINADTMQEFGRWQSVNTLPASDFSCTYRFKWDEKYLYVLEVRTDKHYISNFNGNDYNAQTPWALDGTAIFFCDNEMTDPSNRCDIKFYSYVDELKGPSVYIGNGNEASDAYVGPSGEGDTTYGGSVNGETIVFELKLAWSVIDEQWHLDSEIKEGTVFRFTPIIMSRDTIDDYNQWDGSSYAQMNFHDCMNLANEDAENSENPEYWAALTLSAAGAGSTESTTSAETAPAEEAPAKSANGVIDATAGFDGEGAENLFDNDENTKWCLNTAAPVSVTWKTDATTATGYEIVTANDNAEYTGRNPDAWTLYGSNDGSTWTVLDAVEADDVLGDVNFTPFTFAIDSPAEYSYYKFEVTNIVGGGVMQISGLNLLTGAVTASAAQAEPAEETAAAPAPESAPQTFDVGVIAAVTAVISAAGYSLSKKR